MNNKHSFHSYYVYRFTAEVTHLFVSLKTKRILIKNVLTVLVTGVCSQILANTDRYELTKYVLN